MKYKNNPTVERDVMPQKCGIPTGISLLTAAVCMINTAAYAVEKRPGLQLEEIVVTAQKREQNLQDVPIAVSAFTGEHIQNAVIKDIFDLQNSAPGLGSIQEQSNSASGFRLRGIGTSAQNFGLESAVGMYVDGVYRARQSSMINELIDIEAVEILRGPQGTLFGKNTPAGAIQFRTVAPGHEVNGFASVTAGNYGQLNASAAGNVSIIDDILALRGTVFSSQRDGTFDVNGLGNNVLNDRNREGGRLQAMITPSDDLIIRVIADYSNIDEACCGVSVVQDNYTVAGGKPGSDFIIQNMLGGTVYRGGNSGDFETSLSFLPESDSRDRGLTVDVGWDLNDQYTLNLISGYRKYHSSSLVDADFTDTDVLSRPSNARSTTFSQEIRLDYSGENLNFVVGSYYFKQDLDLDSALRSGADLNALATAGDISDFIKGTASLGNLGVSPASPQVFLPAMVASHTARQKHESWAVFGQFDYSITDKLVLTAGIRYTEEQKQMDSVFSENWIPSLPAFTSADFDLASKALSAADNGNPVPLLTLLNSDPDHFDNYVNPGWGAYLFPDFAPRADIHVSLDDEQITGTIKLAWFASDNTMVYASYGTGYKSGGTNTDRITVGFDPVFDAETSESFELGLKTELPEQAIRINAALHYTTVDDFQSSTFVGTGFILQNAGKLESYGGELELFWIPKEKTEVSLSYAYTHAIYDEFKGASCQIATPAHTGVKEPRQPGTNACDRSGDRLSLTPEHAINLGIKEIFSLTDSINGYVYGEYTFLSDMVMGNDNDPLKEQKEYGLLNLRAGLNFVNNAVSVTLWGRNVLDKAYKGSTFDVPLQDGKLLTAPGEPRTYGVTLNKVF